MVPFITEFSDEEFELIHRTLIHFNKNIPYLADRKKHRALFADIRIVIPKIESYIKLNKNNKKLGKDVPVEIVLSLNEDLAIYYSLCFFIEDVFECEPHELEFASMERILLAKLSKSLGKAGVHFI